MTYTKRLDGRKADETREIRAEVGVVDRADGSALFAFGETVAIAAVYGPRQLYPQRLQDPTKGIVKCIYDMLSFSVKERKRPGPTRRSQEISLVTENSLSPAVKLEAFPTSVVDVYISILEANASTRCAGINAASLALAHAGIPMRDLVTSVSIGLIGNKLVADITKEEEDYEEKGVKMATDMPIAVLPRTGEVSLLQLDGEIKKDDLKKGLEMGKKVCEKICEVQKKALRDAFEKLKN